MPSSTPWRDCPSKFPPTSSCTAFLIRLSIPIPVPLPWYFSVYAIYGVVLPSPLPHCGQRSVLTCREFASSSTNSSIFGSIARDNYPCRFRCTDSSTRIQASSP
ncbi:hypothetical protein C8R44DRAFT_772323 [Mycena epipterygia]|nr:hypothetical protein C8R44DRAFT_772323 [Mycena epipterygia]